MISYVDIRVRIHARAIDELHVGWHDPRSTGTQDENMGDDQNAYAMTMIRLATTAVTLGDALNEDLAHDAAKVPDAALRLVKERDALRAALLAACDQVDRLGDPSARESVAAWRKLAQGNKP